MNGDVDAAGYATARELLFTHAMTLIRSVRRPRHVRAVPIVLGCVTGIAMFFVVIAILGDRGEADAAKRAKYLTTDLLQMWKQQTGECRLPTLEFPDQAHDPWGREVRFVCDATEPSRRAVISAGEDRAFGTGDDIASWR